MKAKTRYGFSYGTAGKRKSGNLSSVSSVYYVDGKTLGLNKGHYCVPIRKNGNGTYDVVTLTSLSISRNKFNKLKAVHSSLVNDYFPFKVNGRVHYISKSKLNMVMRGSINPLPLGQNEIWKGVDLRIIQAIDLNKLERRNNIKLNL